MSQIFRPYGATHERLGEKNMFSPFWYIGDPSFIFKDKRTTPPLKKEWNLYLKLKWVAVSTDGQVSIEQVLRRHEIIEWLWQLRVLIVCELVGPKMFPQIPAGDSICLVSLNDFYLIYCRRCIILSRKEYFDWKKRRGFRFFRTFQRSRAGLDRKRNATTAGGVVSKKCRFHLHILRIACVCFYIYIRLAHICVRLVYNLKKRGSSFITFYYYSSI